MTARAAGSVPFRSTMRAPEAQPLTKLRVLERVRALIGEGELQPIDMNVAQYLGEITDKEAGDAIVEVATIAERIGRSRPTVVRALRRLIDAGVIYREARRKGKRCYASSYGLVDPDRFNAREVGDMPKFNREPGLAHPRTTSRAFMTNLSPDGPGPRDTDVFARIYARRTATTQPGPAQQKANKPDLRPRRRGELAGLER